jgi:hypothetical protein
MDIHNIAHNNDTLILDDIPRSSLMNIGPVTEACQEDEQSERTVIEPEQPRFSTESLIGFLKESGSQHHD